jgi:glycosyltransferase involved in cell wall biosynthesis
LVSTTSLSTVQIGLIASGSQTSGSDRYYFSLLRSLQPLGVGVRGVVLGDPEAIDEPVPGVASFAPEGSRTLGRWLGLRRTVRPMLRGSDLVVSHFAPHAFPVLDQIAARPFVVHFHGPWALEGRAAGLGRKTLLVREIEERAVYARAQRIVVLSRAFGEILTRSYGVPAEKIRVVPGGVDLARFRSVGAREDVRRALGWPVDRPIVLTVRRLAPTKGIENLIASSIELRRRIPDVLVMIAGTGHLAAQFQRQVRELGLDDTIRFAGYVPDEDLPRIYRAADLFVVPTVAFEGFGLVVLESLACGTPVLVTPVSGLPEVVDALDRRLILRDSSANAIAQGVADALSGSLPLPSEERCIAYAERFGWPEIARLVRDVYAEVA